MAKRELMKNLMSDTFRRVAIYIRVSTNHQVDKDSLPLQREELINYCKYVLGIEDFEIFEDAGFSAKNTDRPGYQKMMKMVRAGLFTHVLVWKLDRISRNLLDFAYMYEELKKLDVAFISKNEQFDTSTAMGEAMLKIILVFAELERKTTSERVAATMISRAVNGKWNGGRVPYGYSYDYEQKEFSVNPEEQKVALLMCDLYEASNSLLFVSRKLNEIGYRSRAGNLWSPVQVRKVLVNPFNTGKYVYNQTSLSTGTQLPNKEEDFIVIEDHHPALIPQERQDRLIARLNRNARSRSTANNTTNRKNIHVFSGLIYCENCGNMLTSSVGKKLAGDGWRPSIYLCPSKRKHVSDGCHDTTDSSVGEFVLNFIMNMLNAQRNFQLVRSAADLQRLLLYGKVFDDVDHLDQDSLNDMFTVLSSNLPQNVKAGMKKKMRKPPSNPEVTKLNKEKQRLERAMERLKRLYMYSDDSMTEQEYITEKNRIADAYSEAEARIVEITNYERMERSISDEDFVRQATAFILSKKLSGSSYINYRKLAVSTDPLMLKEFFNSILDSITINTDGKVGSIVFKNGLRHQFIYTSNKKEDKTMLAKCNYCGQVMLEADGCTKTYFTLNGKQYPRIRVGDKYDFEPGTTSRCHDCAAKPGEYHHSGCDAERCPVCHEQLIGCECDFSDL
ncbi:MAG: recombinase family protein [Blautia massiliensis (ex Durand et al. 2017)]|uniref:recombinase family protein n=1 Tax=Blautia massiliensis (ex Durand et al. 2017) TaxID=1737424 RepID=UPI003996BBB0